MPAKTTKSTAVETATDEVAEVEQVNFFYTFRRITAGEKLQLLKRLDVTEQALSQTGTAMTVAVAWKHARDTNSRVGVEPFLGMTDDELLESIGLTEADYLAQIEAKSEADSKSGRV